MTIDDVVTWAAIVCFLVAMYVVYRGFLVL